MQTLHTSSSESGCIRGIKALTSLHSETLRCLERCKMQSWAHVREPAPAKKMRCDGATVRVSRDCRKKCHTRRRRTGKWPQPWRPPCRVKVQRLAAVKKALRALKSRRKSREKPEEPPESCNLSKSFGDVSLVWISRVEQLVS